MLTETSIERPDGPLNLARVTGGEQPVVMLHGVTNRWQSWLPVLPYLALRYDCIAADLRGHGASFRSETAYGMEGFAGDIVALLDQTVDRAAVLVGHSLGALVAMAVAARTPDRVAALVLEDPPLGAITDVRDLTPPFFHQYLDLMTGTDDDATRILRLAEVSEGLDAATLRAQLASLKQVDPALLHQGAEGGLLADMSWAETVPRIACPTLLMTGNPDLGGVIEDGVRQRFLSEVDQAAHMHRADLGHALHIPDPQFFATAVTHWCEALD